MLSFLSPRRAFQPPLYSFPHKWCVPQVRCLNEATESSAKGVFRPWGERLDFSGPPLASNEDDEELLIHVPFNGSVKIKAICIIGVFDIMLSDLCSESLWHARMPVLPLLTVNGEAHTCCDAAAGALHASGTPIPTIRMCPNI